MSQVLSRYFDGMRIECFEPQPESTLPSIRICSTDFDWKTSRLSIFVVVGFGGVHLTASDPSGAQHEFPIGTAHFLEHLLFWRNLESHLIPLEEKFLSSPNAVVTHNQMIWYVTDVHLSRTAPLQDAITLVKHLTAVLRFDPSTAQIDKALLNKVREDVYMEIGYRGDFLEYLATTTLLGGLFPDHPVRHNMLGSKESLASLTQEHLKIALEVIRTNIVSINLTGNHLPANLMPRLIEIVQRAQLGSLSRHIPVEPSVTIAPPITNIGFPSIRERGRAFVGFSLPPLKRGPQPRNDMRRFLTEEHCCTGHIAGGEVYSPGRISWPHARAFFGASDCPPFFFIDPQQRADVVSAVCSKIAMTPHRHARSRRFKPQLEAACLKYRDEWEWMLRLVTAADLFGWSILDMLDTFRHLERQDFEELAKELKAASYRPCLVYSSPVVRLLQ